MSSFRIRYVSEQQLDLLWEFLNSHKDLATSLNRSLTAKDYARKRWREVAEVLNAQNDGAPKEWKDWAKYWVCYKAKLKRKLAAIQASEASGGQIYVHPLTDIELKFLQILGSDFGQGLHYDVKVVENSGESLSGDSELPQSPEIACQPQQPHSWYDVCVTKPQSDHVTPSTPVVEPAAAESAAVESAAVKSAAVEPAAVEPAARMRPRKRRYQITQEDMKRAFVVSARKRAKASKLRAEASQLSAEANMRLTVAAEGIRDSLRNIEGILRNFFPSDDNSI